MISTPPNGPKAPCSRRWWLSVAAITFLLAPAAACGGGRDDVVESRGEEALEEAPGRERERAQEIPPEHIYYDLTAFDWYRRGEPLRIDELAYLPRGKPISLGEARLEEAGEYQGVVYYRVEGASEPYPAVYVAVSPGYWQPFVTSLLDDTDEGSQ